MTKKEILNKVNWYNYFIQLYWVDSNSAKWFLKRIQEKLNNMPHMYKDSDGIERIASTELVDKVIFEDVSKEYD